MAALTGHASPFHCPYCGEETIRPFDAPGDPHGQWECTSCRRAFTLRLLGLTRPGGGDVPAPRRD